MSLFEKIDTKLLEAKKALFTAYVKGFLKMLIALPIACAVFGLVLIVLSIGAPM